MTPAELLAELARLRVDVITGPDGRPRLDGVLSDELVNAARRYRWLFAWGLWGSQSGHVWFVCDVCSEVQLLSHERTCGLKPGCKGRMHVATGPVFAPSEVGSVAS
jgi:hypothetical protein